MAGLYSRTLAPTPMTERAGKPGLMANVRDLPRPAGWADSARQEADGWRIGGWMALPDSGPFNAVSVSWEDRDLGLASPAERPDLESHLYWVRAPERCGFSFFLPGHDAQGRLALTGDLNGRPAGLLTTLFIAPQLEEAALPPPALAERVSDLSGDAFRLSGLKAFTDVWDQIAEHTGDPRALTILDWGCGCGRISRYLARAGVSGLRGCDIDPAAVGWCSENLPGEFVRCGPEPPLPYGDGEVDVVVASSVFTHLDRDHQRTWLSELRRIISPGGLLVASIAGEYAFTLGASRLRRPGQAPGSLLPRAAALRKRVALRRAGIIDRFPDAHLEGIAPSDYYKMVYQTRDFIERSWTRDFELATFIERGLAGHQDLVVMRPA